MALSLSMFDPTSSKSPLGGFVRTGLNAIPGGSTALGLVDNYNATRRAAETSRDAPTDRGGSSSPPSSAPGSTKPAGVLAFFKRPVVLIVGAVAIVGTALVLLLRRA
jgi:hypothetical protein